MKVGKHIVFDQDGVELLVWLLPSAEHSTQRALFSGRQNYYI